MYKKNVLILSLSLASMSLPAQVTEKVINLEEVVVTAQGREEKMLNVPITMSSISSELLEMTNTTELQTLSDFIPGLNIRVQTPHRPTFVIRGLTSDEVSPTAQPRVSTYFNNTPISRASMAKSSLFDMERVEVVKGPQGTLFGRGSQIGGINFITKKPEPEFGGFVGTGIGNLGMKEVEGAINAPVIPDKLMIRTGGNYIYRDGYVENLSGNEKLGGINSANARFSVRYLPANNLRIDFVMDYQNDKDNGTPFMSKRFPNTNGESDIFKLKASLDDGKEFYNKRNLMGTMFDVNYRINDKSYITSLTSYHNNKTDSRWDGDGTVAPAIEMTEFIKANQFTQELRYNFSQNRLKGFVGGSYWRENVRQEYGFNPNEQSFIWLLMDEFQPGMADMLLQNNRPNLMSDAMLHGMLAEMMRPQLSEQVVAGAAAQYGMTPEQFLAANGGMSAVDFVKMMEQAGQVSLVDIVSQQMGVPAMSEREEKKITTAVNSSYDLFADLSFDITDKLIFTAGVRGTWERLSVTDLVEASNIPSTVGYLSGIFAPPYTPNHNFLFAVSPFKEEERKYFSATYRANLKYLISNESTVYAGYSKGYRPPVLQPETDGSITEIKAETVDNFEAGFKYFKKGLFGFDAGVFYYLYKDFQATTFENFYTILPVDMAKSYGAEMNFNITTCNYLDLFGNYAYIHARFKDDIEHNGQTYNFKDNRFRLTPDHSLTLGMNVKSKITDNTGVIFTPTYSYKSKVWFEDNNDDELTQDAYGLLNLNLTFRFQKPALNVSFFCNNLTNEKYIISAGNTGTMFGVPTFVPGLPTTSGVKLKWNF